MNPSLLNGSTLAFVGDAVLSLLVREHLVAQGLTKAKALQEASVAYVSAKAQAKFVTLLIESNQLSEEELTIYRRGRNHRSDSIAKNADVITYRQATGYWHLTQNEARLKQIWDQMKTTL